MVVLIPLEINVAFCRNKCINVVRKVLPTIKNGAFAKNIITSRKPDDLPVFMKAVIDALLEKSEWAFPGFQRREIQGYHFITRNFITGKIMQIPRHFHLPEIRRLFILDIYNRSM